MGHNLDAQSQVHNKAGSTATFGGSVTVGEKLTVNGPVYHDGVVAATKVDIALAASATTDGMDITFTIQDEDGNTVPGAHVITWWISESSDGVGLTADSYSGDVTTGTGTELAELTTKKAFIGLTGSAGTLVATAVDSANPADQYVAAQLGNRVFVSSISSTNWEGA